MRSIMSEYGSFLAEVIAGTAVLATIALMWPIIRNFMDRVVFMLI